MMYVFNWLLLLGLPLKECFSSLISKDSHPRVSAPILSNKSILARILDPSSWSQTRSSTWPWSTARAWSGPRMPWSSTPVWEIGSWVSFWINIIHNFSIFQNVLFQVKINILLLPTPRSLVLMKSSDVSWRIVTTTTSWVSPSPPSVTRSRRWSRLRSGCRWRPSDH